VRALVIIPSAINNYTFSAPLAWLFSAHTRNVRGVYGFELNDRIIRKYNCFILELNWFYELEEFRRVVERIKSVNKHSVILFGGLYAALKHKTIFEWCPVDYYIQGDNEYPLQLFLNSENPKSIPNFIGRNFKNPVEYVFTKKDYDKLEFNLDWFPSYFRYCDPAAPYQLPMIFTTKGGCTTAHEGCDYCLGSRSSVLRKIYHRPSIIMSNGTLMMLLKKIERSFKRATIFISSAYNYDFSNNYFDLDVTFEIFSKPPLDKVQEIFSAFRKCRLHLGIYKKGLMGHRTVKDFLSVLKYEDKDHVIKFAAYDKHRNKHMIPADHFIDSGEIFPWWTHFNYYMDFKKALKFSQRYSQWREFEKVLNSPKEISVK
jgi:hypothetical protein